MHHLDRQAVPAPGCLADYRHGAHTWSEVTPDHKAEIRTHLQQLQGLCCAYCESSLEQGQHVEHFRPRDRFPTLTFAWSNLFWSCDCVDHCGHYKDTSAAAYNPDDLIDPAVDDPERFFRFYSDGQIRVRSEITDAERLRATETLRVLNLEHDSLRYGRRAACSGYVQEGAELAELAQQLSAVEVQQYLASRLASTRHLPFKTAIKHTLSTP